MKNLYLHYNQGNHRGPGKVVQNLLKGLEGLDVNVVNKPGSADYYGCLQHPGQLVAHLPEQTLMGPNIFVLPEEHPYIVHKFKNFVVPSDWVKDLYFTDPKMQDKTITSWPVGIDTDRWVSLNHAERRLDCFIYYKNRSPNELMHLEKSCKRIGLRYEINEYGSYTEEALMSRCARSDFAILLTDTESQGVAYMNILSTGTPCFVINKTHWEGKAPATSVPYFDNRCGIITDSFLVNLDLLEQFIADVRADAYAPRDYIVENHTLLKGAQAYMNIFENAGKNNES